MKPVNESYLENVYISQLHNAGVEVGVVAVMANGLLDAVFTPDQISAFENYRRSSGFFNPRKSPLLYSLDEYQQCFDKRLTHHFGRVSLYRMWTMSVLAYTQQVTGNELTGRGSAPAADVRTAWPGAKKAEVAPNLIGLVEDGLVDIVEDKSNVFTNHNSETKPLIRYTLARASGGSGKKLPVADRFHVVLQRAFQH